MNESKVLMSAKGLTKRFGGLAAVNDVSLDLWHGKLHAVIGPNGAGKSTLTNLLSGDLPPTSGNITLDGHDITGWTPEKISRHRLGRSYQKTNIFRTFTDWDNVRSATPQYPGHLQPRVPLGGNYYDQSELATLRWQVKLAKKYGVHGFCHYHYWFDGRQLLETPTNLMLDTPDIDFPFCLSWANETWSRRWDGRDHEVLIQQTHPPCQESWRRHFDYLIKAWRDPRAIRVDSRPVFVIYRPQNIPKIAEMLMYWRHLAQAHGLPGLYFIHQKSYDLPNAAMLQGFDAVFQFQPSEAVHSPVYGPRSIRQSPLFRLIQRLPERQQDWLRGLRTRFRKDLKTHDYASVWRAAIEMRSGWGLPVSSE